MTVKDTGDNVEQQSILQSSKIEQSKATARDNQVGAGVLSPKAGTTELPSRLEVGSAFPTSELMTSGDAAQRLTDPLQVEFSTSKGIYYDAMHVNLNDLSRSVQSGNTAKIADNLSKVSADAVWWEHHEAKLGTNSGEAKNLESSMAAAQEGLALMRSGNVAEGQAKLALADATVQNDLVDLEKKDWIRRHPDSGNGGTGGGNGSGGTGGHGGGGDGGGGSGSGGTGGGGGSTGEIPPPKGSTAIGGLDNANNESPNTKASEIGGSGDVQAISATQDGSAVNFSVTGGNWGDGLWLTKVKTPATEQNKDYNLQLNDHFELTASDLKNDHEIEKDIEGPWGMAGTQINPHTGEVDFWNAKASKWVDVGSLGPLQANKDYNLQIGVTSNGNPDSGSYTFDYYALNGVSVAAPQTYQDKNLGWSPGIYIQTQLDLPGSPNGTVAGLTETGQTLYVS